MAEALKMKDESIRGGGGDGGSGSGAMEKLGEHPRRLRQFLHEVRVEMDKVSWPSRQDVISTTTVVIVTVTLFGFFFLGTDSLAQKIVGWMIDFGSKH
jgi:preprotein translocase subunit SecE